MGLFTDRTQKEPQPRNMQTLLMVRVLAVGYVLYMLYNIVKSYFAGGEDAPSLGLLVAAAVLLGGGSLFVAIVTWKEYKAHREAELRQQEAQEEETQEDDNTL